MELKRKRTWIVLVIVVLMVCSGVLQHNISIKSSGQHITHGGILTRAVVSPDGRFLVEGELNNPEPNKRKAMITIKDLKNSRIHGKDL